MSAPDDPPDDRASRAALEARRQRFRAATARPADAVEPARTRVLEAHGTRMLCVEAGRSAPDAVAWLTAHRAVVDAARVEHGGVLLRGFAVDSLEDFQHIAQVFCPELAEYEYGSTPRTRLEGKVYTSTEYPADQHIPLHGEQSYALAWPTTILFHCVVAAETGGETPYADAARVYERIDASVRERFERDGVMYVRNYGAGDGLDLSWQTAFQSRSRVEVELACARMGMAFEWRTGERLRTWQICQASTVHPGTGVRVWFNQAHLFHVSGLPDATREALLGLMPEDELPRNARYGDGTPIEPAALDDVRRAYDASALAFPWQRGDVTVLDNVRLAHGRAPFTGARRVVVAMGGRGGA